MKAADPNIKIGVVVTESWKDRAEVLLGALKRVNLWDFIVEGYQGWTPKMLASLRELGVTPDWVSFHHYPQSLSGTENDARLLQSTSNWARDAAALRRHLNNYFGLESTNVEMHC